jgi:hypothetical protein
MAERVPNILRDVLDRNPDYPASIRDRVRALREEIVMDAPLRLFDPPAPDHDTWRRRFRPHEGDTWLDAEWFFAEMLAYRRLMAACRYWTTRRDPFRPVKQDEIESAALRDAITAALDRSGARQETLRRALLGALWGNRIDLSMHEDVAAQGTDAADDQLLADDLSAVVDDLLAGPAGPVHIIMDNAGTEAAFDLILTDFLLAAEVASTVVLHVKMMPVLVSDALRADIFWLLDALGEGNGPPAQLATRLREALRDGHVRLVPDRFWHTDGRLHELPPRLEEAFREAALVIGKGDANYRRATNDALWPDDASWAEAVSDVPGPFLALRTVKSDTLVGVAPAAVRRLDRGEEGWRTRGTYGVAQYVR